MKKKHRNTKKKSQTLIISINCDQEWIHERWDGGIEDSTHSAEFATADDDSALVKHTSVKMEHVIDINCYEVLCEVPLQQKNTNNKYTETLQR